MTGHTGFKGAWLSEWLLQSNAVVSGYSLKPQSSPNLYDTLGLDSRMRSSISDIRDFKSFENSVAEFKPEVIFHLAAQALVRQSYLNPVETYATNVLGTVHCLQIARTVPSVKAVVVVTSDKCYENFETNKGFVESDRMGGRDPYSNSKGCAELVTSSFRESFFTPEKKFVASARAGNVIGGGDWSEDRLIPDLMRGFQAGKAVPIRNPNSVRPWQHVLDPLHGYLMLAKELLSAKAQNFSSGWNFGPPEKEAANVKDVVNAATELWGPGAKWTTDSGAHPHEAKLLQLNCTKAQTELQWKPQWGLQRSLKETVEWYKTYGQSPAAAAELTRKQIQAFAAEIH